MAHFYTGQLQLARMCVRLRPKSRHWRLASDTLGCGRVCGALPERPSVRFCVALLRPRGCTPCDAVHLSLRTHERNPAAYIRIPFMGLMFSRDISVDKTLISLYNIYELFVNDRIIGNI